MFQKDLLKNKTILITGGGTGLGKSMATKFGELGANLIITSRRQNVLDDAAEDLAVRADQKNIANGLAGLGGIHRGQGLGDIGGSRMDRNHVIR